MSAVNFWRQNVHHIQQLKCTWSLPWLDQLSFLLTDVLSNEKFVVVSLLTLPLFVLVYSVFAAQRSDSLPAGAFRRAPFHAARLELGLLRRVRILPRPVPPCLDRVPPAGPERHPDMQTDLPSHPSRLQGRRFGLVGALVAGDGIGHGQTAIVCILFASFGVLVTFICIILLLINLWSQ